MSALLSAKPAGALLLVACLGAGLTAPPLAAKEKKEKVTPAEFLRRVPLRVKDKDGTAGDMVNFVLVGSREKVTKALTAAGWKQVDRTKTEAAIRAVLSTIQKKPYTELPISELYLFGRAQDYGYAQAESLRVVAERHHFRVWEAPWVTTDGDKIWIGAGTHDIGFEEDRRSGKVTHQIDPEVDKEREFIGETLKHAGRAAGAGYLLPEKPVREATTAHGGKFRSDGRVLVILLK